ncbi:malectin domain-containing carbohydrate-binding protein [Mucilaginibacter agri]|uniref:T9SS type A sorting domain-containing protein n=1 Tax=Mucilaginibacter agri TaxID=2695265 RepID=A0A965ZMP7_9SPHI|nr:malectin domain-containing carbohydrate-binding protein [Mucilaginibacter agri]NCD72411.1 T9SS type A sorting domain-containing protein [Mucilaginibacter agri]
MKSPFQRQAVTLFLKSSCLLVLILLALNFLMANNTFAKNKSFFERVDHKVHFAAAAFTGVSINFQTAAAPIPDGFIADVGLAFDATRGYGWINTKTKLPEDHTANMRFRQTTDDLKLRTLVQMQATTLGQTPGNWEYAIPNGKYLVTISAGDGTYDNDSQINAEGLPVITDFISTPSMKFTTGTVLVQVNDGRLTIDAKGGLNTRMNYIIIAPAPAKPVADAIKPTASLRVVGSLASPGVYKTTAKVYIKANDQGGSGLASFQYAMNGSAYKDYISPMTLTVGAAYAITVKVTDGNGNQTITGPYNFTISTTPAAGRLMTLKNLDNFPSNDRLVASRIQTPWRRTSPDTTPYNANHDKVKLRISNKGTGNLTIGRLKLSNPASWKIVSLATDTNLTLPLVMTPQTYADVTIQFIGNNVGTRVKMLYDTLTVVSDDSIAPVKKVNLTGIWQVAGESTNEPFAQQLMDAFGFKTVIGYGHDDGDINGTTRVPNSDEVTTNGYFLAADPSKPVTVLQVAAYHSCCNAVESFKYFYKGKTSTTSIITHNNLYGQSILPYKVGSTTSLAQATFTPAAGGTSFGFKVGSSSSDRTQNYNGLIGIRFYKAVDSDGKIIPNAYFMLCDYLNTPFTNYDYQDNVYYIDNITPESGSPHYSNLASTPSAVNFAPVLVGNAASVGITLNNTGKNYADSSTDPAIKITSAIIVGPNSAEFSVGTVKSSLNIQTGTPVNITFKPTSAGIKNAALMVNYSTAPPLRIPLYGIGNTSTTTVNIVKRIKSGSDVAMTVGGKTYEADKSYRSGSTKLDVQTVSTPISSTDDDQLYQSYLSSGVDLGTTNYEIPLANGNYMVRMHFAENYWTASASRIFNISMENIQVLGNFDIFGEVGYRSALVKDFSTTVSDGALSIKMVAAVNRNSLAAIEIFQVINTTTMAKVSLADKQFLTTDSAATISAIRSVTLYPNPNAGNIVYLKAANFAKQQAVTVNISNMLGTLIQTQVFITGDTGEAVVTIPITKKLEKGVYLVNTYSSTGVTYGKLLVK